MTANKPWETHPQFIYTYNYNQSDIRVVELAAARALYEGLERAGVLMPHINECDRCDHWDCCAEVACLKGGHDEENCPACAFEKLLWPEGRKADAT